MTATRLVTYAGSTTGAYGATDAYGTAARFNCPTDLATSLDGTLLYVVDYGNRSIRTVDPATTEVATLYTFPSDRRPVRLAVGQITGDLFITVWPDSGNTSIIARLTPNGDITYLFASDPTGADPTLWNSGGYSTLDVDATETWAVVKHADTKGSSSFTNTFKAYRVDTAATSGPATLYPGISGHISPYTPNVYRDGAFLNRFGEGICYLPVPSYYRHGVVDDSVWDIPAVDDPGGIFHLELGYVGPAGNGVAQARSALPPDYAVTTYTTYTDPAWEIARGNPDGALSVRRNGTGEMLLACRGWSPGCIFSVTYDTTPEATTSGFPLDLTPDTAETVCDVNASIQAADTAGGLTFALLSPQTRDTNSLNQLAVVVRGGWTIGQIGIG